MVTANDNRSKLPARAIHCNCQQMSKPKATKNSPKVAAEGRAGMAGPGANQLSSATYPTNGSQAPQATCGAPGGPTRRSGLRLRRGSQLPERGEGTTARHP